MSNPGTLVHSKSKPKSIRIGSVYIIGKPVNETYLYLESNLPQYESHDQSISLSSHKLIGKMVSIVGILNRANSKAIYILGRRDRKDFYKGLTKIYADLENALVAKELLAV
ncbi:hypothetical protein [Flagellimonas flava]|uniref:Uncharacterized protein n=1 Tax=Flagellimonas flava TaxID=570519 RepID=A0A1M5KER4_9FLAO|nr:hypothetical protein [Allomuricauda flava]SHG51346.1 hypothetical protein SAMN04488116_1545 [Allomuricauda flava]